MLRDRRLGASTSKNKSRKRHNQNFENVMHVPRDEMVQQIEGFVQNTETVEGCAARDKMRDVITQS